MNWEDVPELSETRNGYTCYRVMERAWMGSGYMYRETILSHDGNLMSSSIAFVPDPPEGKGDSQ